MKKIHLIIIALAGVMISAVPSEKIPQADITNGIIDAKIYLPDPINGYYRGTRFDWSGVIADLQYKGHSYFGQWFQHYDPEIHDAIMGPVEDFSPLGYDEAKVGDSFIKIGIGVLIKPEEKRYTFANRYKIINSGKWDVKKKSDQVEFTHVLNDKSYSYRYKKTVQLSEGKPEMVLIHSLTNTGKQTIETNVYDHNFFMLDRQPTGPDFSITFPFQLSDEGSRGDALAKLEGNQIVFLKDLAKNEHAFYPSLTGFSNSAEDYDIRIENRKTGAGVRITSDRPLSKLVFWSASTTVCPEPYIHVKVAPGESFSWEIRYHFYTVTP